MKRIVLTFYLMITGIIVFAQTGTIREISGTVELKKTGTVDFIPAKTGDIVNQETVISTGFKSTAIVQIGSNMLTIRPLTRLTLTEITAASGSETLNVNLQAGRVRVDIKPPAGTKASTSVSSPSATASVRGTSFEFDTRNIFVNDGTVSFRGSRGAGTLVNAGSSSKIKSDGKAAHPIEVSNQSLRPSAPVGYDNGGENIDITSSLESGSVTPLTGYFTITLTLD